MGRKKVTAQYPVIVKEFTDAKIELALDVCAILLNNKNKK